MNNKAPDSEFSELVDSPVDKIWTCLTDIGQWSKWWPGHKLLLVLPGRWQKGANMIFDVGMRSTISEFIPNEIIEFGLNHPAGFSISRSFMLTREGECTRITYKVKILGADMHVHEQEVEMELRKHLLQSLVKHLKMRTKEAGFLSKIFLTIEDRKRSRDGEKRERLLARFEDVLNNESIRKKLKLSIDSPRDKHAIESFAQGMNLSFDEAATIMQTMTDATALSIEGITHFKMQVGTETRIWFDAAGTPMGLLPDRDGWLQGLEGSYRLDYITKYKKYRQQ